MSLIALESWQQVSKKGASGTIGPSPADPLHAGHPHFWERAMARRQFLMTTASALGLVLGSGLWQPQLARAAKPASALPKPIPEGFMAFGELFHQIDPGPGNEPSMI